MKIRKKNGDYQEFSIEKLKKSLKRSGATDENIKKICDDIQNNIHKITSTRKLYRKAFTLLKKLEKSKVIFRYTIKKAINDLGPSGFPFEKFIAGIYRSLGWSKVRTGVKVKGQCVTHEVDMVAEKDGKKIVSEIKFHNKAKIKTDLKVILYVKERDDDLQRAGFFEDKQPIKSLITNTIFSENVKRYGECVGMNLVSWDYPRDYNLHHMIMESELKPITCLTMINKTQKRELAENGFVFCNQVAQMTQKDFKNIKSLSSYDINDVVVEAGNLCQCR